MSDYRTRLIYKLLKVCTTHSNICLSNTQAQSETSPQHTILPVFIFPFHCNNFTNTINSRVNANLSTLSFLRNIKPSAPSVHQIPNSNNVEWWGSWTHRKHTVSTSHHVLRESLFSSPSVHLSSFRVCDSTSDPKYDFRPLNLMSLPILPLMSVCGCIDVDGACVHPSAQLQYISNLFWTSCLLWPSREGPTEKCFQSFLLQQPENRAENIYDGAGFVWSTSKYTVATSVFWSLK